jgi:probable F420-dependent oxidoreductase
MKVGICTAGVGPCSTGDFIRRSAQAAERSGFSSFWIGDHLVLFSAYPESPYPYAGVNPQWGDPPIPDPRLPLYEPVMAMAWAAAATTTLEVGSSILILPQRNPVVLAKELSVLDEFSGGRVTLGAGVGWCKEEMDAVGADWKTRGKRMDEYIDAMRALWSTDAAEFNGPTVQFRDAYMYPRPVRPGGIPVMIGGDTEIAQKRVARTGDGWLAFNLPVAEAPARVARLKALTREAGRDPEALRISVAIFSWTEPDELKRYRDAGITEFLLFKCNELPLDDAGLAAGIDEAARKYVDLAESL